MNRRIRNLSLVAGAVTLAFVGVASLGSPPPDRWPAAGAVRRLQTRSPAMPEPSAGLRAYAISLGRVSGLSTSARVGARLELWVTWEAPVTRAPQVQRLLTGVTLRGIEPPLLPGGPHVAVLLISKAQVPDLVYAERYGSLSAAVVSEP